MKVDSLAIDFRNKFPLKVIFPKFKVVAKKLLLDLKEKYTTN